MSFTSSLKVKSVLSAGFLAVLLILGMVQTGHAQAVAYAGVSGVVTDSSGQVIPGAKVTAIETDKQFVRQTVTDAVGNYVLPNLPTGPYRLEVKATGFKDYVQSGLVLQVGSNVLINVTMQVGAVSETVEVTAVAQMTETKESGISQVIDERKITELPLNGRQATQLVLLSGASVQAPGGGMIGSKNYASSTTISVGGGQANGTTYLLDGGSHTDTMTNVNEPFPFPDALQEFSVETSALSARFGSHPGATVNAVTKSGTNSLHGNLFEFIRNGDLNARNFFSTTGHDTLKRNIFGGTIGGKAIRDKLFFFGGYQGLRNRSTPAATRQLVPNAAILGGDFSVMTNAANGCPQGSGVRLIDPLTRTSTTPAGTQFPNNIIPAARLNAAALKLATGYLNSSSADACGQVFFPIPSTGDENQFISRVDWLHNQKHTVFVRYFSAGFANPSVYDGKNLLTTTQPGNLERVQTATIGDTYSLGPGTLNSAHLTFVRRRDDRGPAQNQIGPNDIGINMFQKVPNFLLVTVTNFWSIGCGTCAPGHFNVNTWNATDDMDLIRGRHHISFGINFIRTQNNLISGFNENANITFTADANGPNSSAATTGLSLADFMIGRVSSFNQSNPTPDDLRQSMWALYVQDSFKWSPKLTLSAGLRWEPLLPNTDKYLRGTFLDFAAFQAGTVSQVYKNAPPGTFFPGDAGFPNSLWNRHLNNFGPRVGLAWNPHGDGRDTLRIGAAILYDSAELFFDERKTTNPPYGSSVQLSSGVSTPTAPTVGPFTNPYANYPGGNPFPAPSLFPLNGVYIQMPRDTKPTYMSQWNATYQRQFKGDWLATVSYLGNKTTHLWVGSEINYAVYQPGVLTQPSTQARRVLSLLSPTKGANYASINQADEGANGHYNALLLSVQHRFGHGFTLLTNYTISRCISDLDFTGELGGSPNSVPNNRGADRGPCGFDVHHVFNTSMVAVAGGFKGNPVVHALTRNWQLAPIIRAVSGGPFTVTTGTDNSLAGLGNDRPDLIASTGYGTVIPCAPTTAAVQVPCLQNYLVKANFAPNPTHVVTGGVITSTPRQGNLGRFTFRGPGALNVDMTLSRKFSITERYKMEVRFDAFNVINRANFNNPTTALNSGSFGQITGLPGAPGGSLLLPGVGDPRILQFAVKLAF